MLNTRNIIWLLGLPAAICVLVQIGLGANFSVLLLAACCIATGLYGFWLLGSGNTAAWFCLFYMAGSVLFAFYGKTFLLQTVDSNLYAPALSYSVQAICGLAMLGALIVSSWVNVGRTMQPITDLATLKFLAWASFIIGLSIEIFHTYGDRGAAGPEYGGLALFGSLMYLGIVARTAYVILRSGGKKHIDSVVLLMLLIATAFGVFMNGRGNTAMPCLYFFATLLFFKGKLPWRYVTALVCGAALFAAIAPMLLVFRYAGLRNMTLQQEADAFTRLLPSILDGRAYAFETGKIENLRAYYHYFGGSKSQVVLGRWATIQQSDPAIAMTENSAPLGRDLFISELRSQLPTFIDPDKPALPVAFTILEQQGLTNSSHGHYPTLPPAGEVYALFGMTGVLIIPFAVFLIYALILKKIGWALYGNVFSIFILMSSTMNAFQNGLQAFIGSMFRTIPALFLTVFCLQWDYAGSD